MADRRHAAEIERLEQVIAEDAEREEEAAREPTDAALKESARHALGDLFDEEQYDIGFRSSRGAIESS